MGKEELTQILDKHFKWIKQEKEGKQADLSYANLRYADLSYANLRYADLSYANLRSANLSYANLSYANLRYANLGKTIYEDINWLAYIGIIPNGNGKARAYKLINKKGKGIFRGEIDYLNGNTFKVDGVDTDINIQCSFGINLATFAWCIENRQVESDNLLIMEFAVKDAVCPIGSDGKFRVRKCRKVGKADWKGNLIKED